MIFIHLELWLLGRSKKLSIIHIKFPISIDYLKLLNHSYKANILSNIILYLKNTPM